MIKLELNVAPPVAVAYCDNVTRRFVSRNAHVVALDDVSLSVGEGELVVIAGPSGSGKSTMLSILGCLDRPTSGSVRVREQELTLLGRRERRSMRRRTVASILPQPSDNLFVGRSGIDNLRLAAKQRDGARADVERVIYDIGIGGFVARAAGRMSGGEQQRLALACALVGGTPLVLADEPTGALDDASAEQVVAAMLHATARGATIVAASHDANVIGAATSVVRLEHGRRVA
ncbi:MAG TPA: ATP-binding cassette domain-containing protein [Ilumatobacter sp.]|nr:ATP-binding cassette domain-containing protein [Ilumatobacter sp.]